MSPPTHSGGVALSRPKENGMDGPRLKTSVPVSLILRGKMKKQARLKLLTREQAEKAVHKYVDAIRKLRGLVSVDMKVVVRVQDQYDPNKAVVILAKHA
jgi:hypothetical protein